MKFKRPPSDRALNSLLSDYRRPELPRARFEAWMDGFEPAAELRPIFKRNSAVSFVTWLPAAAVFLFAVIGGVIFLDGISTLDTPLAVSIRGETQTSSGTLKHARPFRLVTSLHEQATFKTGGELVELGPGSELLISQRSLRMLSGDAGFRYRLELGTLYIEHADSVSSFIVSTKYGSVVPAGTVLSVRVSPDTFSLACLEGVLIFTPSGGGVPIRLEAGNSLAISGNSGMPISSAGDAVAFSGIRSGEPELAIVTPAASELVPETEAVAAIPAVQALVSSRWKKTMSVDGPSIVSASGSSVAVLGEKSLSVFAPSGASRKFTLDLEKQPDAFLLDGDMYMLFGTELQCLDAQNGSEKWRTKTGPSSFSRLRLSGGVLALASADGRLYLTDPVTGRSLGTIRDDEGLGMYGTPLLLDGLVIVSNVDRTLAAYRADGSGKVWSFKADGRFVGDEPVLLGDGRSILDGDAAGTWYAIDKNDGTLSWRSSFKPPLRHQPEVFGNVAVYQDAVGIWSIGTSGQIEKIDASLGELLACMALGGKVALFGTEGIWIFDPQPKVKKSSSLRMAAIGPRRLPAARHIRSAMMG